MKKRVISFLVCICIVATNVYGVFGSDLKGNINAPEASTATQKYTSIEGEWVRVSYSNYYGMTMKIEKNISNNLYTGTISSMSKDTQKEKDFTVGSIKLSDIIQNNNNTFQCNSISTNGEKLISLITINDDFTAMEIKDVSGVTTEAIGSKQRWIRKTEDMNIERMQSVADYLYDLTLKNIYIAFNKDIVDKHKIVKYTKNEANKIIDDYVKCVFEKEMALRDRTDLQNKITQQKNVVKGTKNAEALKIEKNKLNEMETTLKALNQKINKMVIDLTSAKSTYDEMIYIYEKR